MPAANIRRGGRRRSALGSSQENARFPPSFRENLIGQPSRWSFGPGPVSLLDRLCVFARERLAPAIRRVADESMKHRGEMRPVLRNPTLRATSASVFRGSPSSTCACLDALHHHERCSGTCPVYARNCAAKCIRLSPATFARSRRRIGSSICRSIYSLYACESPLLEWREWTLIGVDHFIVLRAAAQVRMAEYRNRR